MTVVAAMKGVDDALAAAGALAEDGIDREVIDLRSLRPPDLGTILASASRTNGLPVVVDGPRLGGIGVGLLGAVAEAAAEERLCTDDTPIPLR